MPFALDSSPELSEISEAVNYLLANFGANLAADPNTGQISGPSGIVVAYLYKYLAIKYADSFDGSSGFSDSPTNKEYYGVNNSNSSVESTNPADYIWYKVAGGGFGTTKFLFYQVAGGRQIYFVVDTVAPDSTYVQAGTDAIDLDIVTTVTIYQNASPTIYQWTSSSTPPARPTTTTTYYWNTGVYTAPSGWYTQIPSNTTAGDYLWAITIYLTESANVATSVLDWTNTSYPIYSFSKNGSSGTAGANGLSALTAYKVQSQSASTPTFSTPTSGATAPSGWSLTTPSVAVGQVLWYLQGKYNSSSTTIDGVAPNTTAWTGPVAASIFQDIRSDNWNGSTPPTYGTPATYGTAGYYIQQSTGDVFFNNGIFRANIDTSGQGKFAGQNNGTYLIRVSGTNYSIVPSVAADATSNSTTTSRTGLYGFSTSASTPAGQFNIGLAGLGWNGGGSAQGIGVVGEGTSYGGYFSGSSSTAIGLTAYNPSSTGIALQIAGGKMQYGATTIDPPPTTSPTSYYLRGDGTWQTTGSIGGGTVTSVSGTGSVYGLTLTGTVTTAGSLTLGGSFTAGSIPTSAINFSGSNIVSRLIGTSGQTSGVNDITFSGSLTGGASGTVTWTMGTTTAAININVTSDSRLKKNVTDLSFGLDFVKQLRPVSYVWNHELFEDKKDLTNFGFIAQEVEALVGTNTSMVGDIAEGPLTGYKYFSNEGIVAALVKSVQELSAEVEALKAQLGK